MQLFFLWLEILNVCLFVGGKVNKRSPASCSSWHCLTFLCHMALTGSTRRGRTRAELEAHTRKFYSLVEWKEISSTSLDLTKAPAAEPSAPSTSLPREGPYMDTCMKYSSSSVTWRAEDPRQIFKESSQRNYKQLWIGIENQWGKRARRWRWRVDSEWASCPTRCMHHWCCGGNLLSGAGRSSSCL